jgi:hypothetical protein
VRPQGASALRAQAAWCRTLANRVSDAPTREILNQTAAEFEAEARAIDSTGATMAMAGNDGENVI